MLFEHRSVHKMADLPQPVYHENDALVDEFAELCASYSTAPVDNTLELITQILANPLKHLHRHGYNYRLISVDCDQLWSMQLRQTRTCHERLFAATPMYIAYDIVVKYAPLTRVSRRYTYIVNTLRRSLGAKLRAVSQLRALGWDWGRRHHFHPAHRRWAVAFLTLAMVAEREGHPLGALPLEILYAIINWVLQRDDTAVFLGKSSLRKIKYAV
jgi:hypothetical protein